MTSTASCSRKSRLPRTVANLGLDPRIEINFVDIFSRRGYRFTGHASVRSAGDPIYHEFAAALRTEHGDAIPIHDAVLVRVLSAKPILKAVEATQAEGFQGVHWQIP